MSQLTHVSGKVCSHLMATVIRCSTVALALSVPSIGAAQSLDFSSAAVASFLPLPQTQEPVRVPSVTVTVVAQKEPVDQQKLPVSVTVVSGDTLELTGALEIDDAAMFAPNTFYSDLFARKVSNARFRGLGSSPANPAITTNIDGVPQLNSNSSNVDLLDVEQVEFVRGGQSALFGRNALGGVVNVVTRRPSLTDWMGTLTLPFGDYGARAARGVFSGPLLEGKLGGGFAFGWAEREGFTKNLVTGNDLDFRSAFSAKGQLVWTPAATWEARVIVSGERSRDGDYPLADLESVRSNPFETMRDFEGHTDRDILSTSVVLRHEGQRVTFTSTTGVVDWETRDVTDLDYTPLSLLVRDNQEDARQFTQEVRFASPAASPASLGGGVTLGWMAGVSMFTQDYDQLAVNTVSPFVFSPMIDFPLALTSPQARLEDSGFGVFGNATLTFGEKFDVSIGVRADREEKNALLQSFMTPALFPGTTVDQGRTFSNVSPQVAVAFRPDATETVYASFGQGFKAGGFNPTSPANSEVYDEERAWHFEAGVKTLWASRRVAANVAVFAIDWEDLQLNLPDLSVPGQFYVANVGEATSRGVEAELTARPNQHVGLFGTFGYTDATFKSGNVIAGVDVGGNDLPNTPKYTASLGAELARPLGALVSVYGRADAVFYGAFNYDERNAQQQEAYSLTNLRAGIRGAFLFAELWVRNAFDARYIPVAFRYDNFAPSGFIGEPGAPRTFGVSGGVKF